MSDAEKNNIIELEMKGLLNYIEMLRKRGWSDKDVLELTEALIKSTYEAAQEGKL